MQVIQKQKGYTRSVIIKCNQHMLVLNQDQSEPAGQGKIHHLDEDPSDEPSRKHGHKDL